MNLPFRIALCSLLVFAFAGMAVAGSVNVNNPIKLQDGELLKLMYMYPHWWDPWKSDDAALASDLGKIKGLGFNTVGLDHEVSQAMDRDWYWLDREYRLAGQEKMYVLPWLQLHSVDRLSLMNYSHLTLKAAVNQDKLPQDNNINFRDGEFKKALTRYVSVYLERYINNPALLRIQDGRTLRPVVGLVIEAGWRSNEGLPLSFDDDTNAYFRKWMKAKYYDLNQLNSKWGTSYKSFDEIDPCDKTIFNYAAADKQKMPVAVQEHMRFRARIVNDTLQSVAEQIRKKYKDVLLAVEIAYPFSADGEKASAYRWNNANDYQAVQFADIVLVRTMGDTSKEKVAKELQLIGMNGKKVVLAYRFFPTSTQEKAVAFALDCALSANGLAYYNWNETADEASAAYNKPDCQELIRLMSSTYDVLHNTGKRHNVADKVVVEPVAPAVLPTPPAPPAESITPVPVEPTLVEPKEDVTTPDEPELVEPEVAPLPVDDAPAPLLPPAEEEAAPDAVESAPAEPAPIEIPEIEPEQH